MPSRPLTVLSAAALLGTSLLLAAPGVALAAGNHPVDPSTLNPAPPAERNPICFRDGSHITCDIAYSDPDVTDEVTPVVCDGTALTTSYSRSVVGKRRYDGDGNLLERHFREYINGTLTNPDTGQTVLFSAHDTVMHRLAVPGDISSGTEHISGVSYKAWDPAGGTIFTDVGVTVIDEATGNLISESGHHLLSDYFDGDTAALAPLCAALA